MAQEKRSYFTNVDASARQLAAASDATITMGLKSYSIYNPNTSDVFVKFYDESSGTVTTGTTEPHYGEFLIPANSQVVLSGGTQSEPLRSFNDYISCAATTTRGGSTSPTLDVEVEIIYWGD